MKNYSHIEWIGEQISHTKFKSFYTSCKLHYSVKNENKDPLLISLGDFILVGATKNYRAYGYIVNMFEDHNVGIENHSEMKSYRADIIYLFDGKRLEETILAKIRKLIRVHTFSSNDLFIPCNSNDHIVSNSMATIQLENILQKLNIQIYDSSKKVMRPTYNILFSRYGFSNDEIVTCQHALKASTELIKSISCFDNQEIDTDKSQPYNIRPKRRCTSNITTESTSKIYNIFNICKSLEKMEPFIEINEKNKILSINTKDQDEVNSEVKPRKRGRPLGCKNKKKPCYENSDIPKLHDCSILLKDALTDEAKNEVHKTNFDKVLCRDKEFRMISNFLLNHLTNATSGCMYISGVPGSGKTHTTLKVIENLSKKHKFKFIHINGMKIMSPNQIYSILCKEILKQKKSISKSLFSLCNYFDAISQKNLKYTSKSTISMPTTVLLIDELDCICNRNQSVLYHLFEWNSQKSSRLITITIANTMDLPERFLSNKIASRLGLTRLTFQPYNYDQLYTVLHEIFVDSKHFEKDALQLISRKVAAVSGDVRRCLDVCQKSIEISKAKLKQEKNSNASLSTISRHTRYSSIVHVSIQDVMEAINNIFSSSKIESIKNLSEYEKLILKCLLTWHKSSNNSNILNKDGCITNSKAISLMHLRRIINNFIITENLNYELINSQQIINIAYQFINRRILKMESYANCSIHTEVSLDIQPESIALVLEKE